MNLILRLTRQRSQISCGSILAASLLASNGAEEIRSYRVPKEIPQARIPDGHSATDGHDHGAGANSHATRAVPKISYNTPEGWREVGAGDMRVAGFSIVGAKGQTAQVAITPLPGMEGRESLIVNMWRQQVGLRELSPEEMAKELTAVDVGGTPGKIFNMSGKSGAGSVIRIVTAMMHRGEQSWFFKLQGDDELVTAQRQNFVTFLKSVKIEESVATTSALPDGHPPIAGSSTIPKTTAPVAAREGGPSWAVPKGWTEVSGGQFLFAKFTITGAGGAAAAVNVSTSSGDGGGLPANVNRWLGQIGKPAWSEAEFKNNVKEIEASGVRLSFVEMTGADGRTGLPAMIIGAMTMRNGSAWFYKLMGEPKLVESQREAFTKFVTEVKY